MTRKEEFIQFINSLTPNEQTRVVFKTNETLDNGSSNTRTVMAKVVGFIELINTKFNDDLYGDYNDGVMTTINSWYTEE